MTSLIECRCQAIDFEAHDGSLPEFEALRSVCPALEQILIPSAAWELYKRFCTPQADEASHAAIAFLAFVRRYLRRLTAPVHRFCLDNGVPHGTLSTQYRRDLIEDWMSGTDFKRRFQKARIFQGRITELHFADWLRNQSWEVEGLEAHGAAHDVIASSPQNQRHIMEIKHIGQDEAAFDLGVKAMQSGGVAVGSLPVYSPVDYLLFRVFEASLQFSAAVDRKVIAIVLDDYDLYYDRPLEEGWIDWRSPKFIELDADIAPFLAAQRAKNANLDDQVRQSVPQIDELWFFDKNEPMSINRRFVMPL